jgi:hypothetical protein
VKRNEERKTSGKKESRKGKGAWPKKQKKKNFV